MIARLHLADESNRALGDDDGLFTPGPEGEQLGVPLDRRRQYGRGVPIDCDHLTPPDAATIEHHARLVAEVPRQ